MREVHKLRCFNAEEEGVNGGRESTLSLFEEKGIFPIRNFPIPMRTTKHCLTSHRLVGKR